MPKRRFIDAPADQRCCWPVMLKDKSLADCGRRRLEDGKLCKQHQKIEDRIVLEVEAWHDRKVEKLSPEAEAWYKREVTG